LSLRPILTVATTLLSLTSCLSAGTLQAQAPGAPSPSPSTEPWTEHWTAQWISHPTAPLREPITLHFKKSLEIAAVPPHYLIHVSGDNRFILYLNGQRIGDGPARGDLAHWRYETFDLAPLLKPGTNLLAATVWNFGVYVPVAQFSDRTAFLVQGNTKAESAADTNSSWQVEEEPGQITRPRKFDGSYDYYASGPGELLLAANYDWNWKTLNQTSGKWVQASSALREDDNPEGGTAASRGSSADVPWALVPDTLPPMAYISEPPGHIVRTSLTEADNFPAKPVPIPAHTHAHILLDRSELTTAYPLLQFSGGAGSHLTLVYTEALFDAQGHKGNRNEVGTRQSHGITDEIYPDGSQNRTFETLWWRTWRYLDIEVETADQPLTLDSLQARYTAYPFNVQAKFESSDPELNKIWAIGWHTAQLDAHETYMDTPYYEQLQYAGDTRIQALITYAMTGDGRLPQQAIRALDDSRIPAGITASRYPSSLPQYIPPFSLLWIGMIHDNYMYSSDNSFVKDKLPGARTVLEWFGSYQHPDGVLGQLPWWTFIDWVETETNRPFPSYDANKESCLTTMQYIGALEDAIDLEKSLGSAEYVALDSVHLALAKNGVVAQCWDAQKQLFADNAAKDMYSEHTNMLAVLFDVAPKQDQKPIMRRVVARRVNGSDGTRPVGDPKLIGASFYFRFYLARALDHADMADDYIDTLGDWRGFLKMGFTTWPEQPGDTRSDSHAWTAHPTYDLLTLVAGVLPGSPGFQTVRIAPHLGNLTHLEATFPHPLGLIHVRYEGAQAHIDLPTGLTGTFVWRGKETSLHGGLNSLTLK
jgi:hypothetical protein